MGSFIVIANARQPLNSVTPKPLYAAAASAVSAEVEPEKESDSLHMSGETMSTVLSQVYPPCPIVHAGVVGANIGAPTGPVPDTRPCHESGIAAAVIRAVARRTVPWQYAVPLAALSTSAPSTATVKEGSRDVRAGVGVVAAASAAAPPLPKLFSRHVFLPLSPHHIARPLHALANAIARAPSTSFDGSSSAAAATRFHCPLSRWPQAPSLYATPVAPLRLPANLIRRLRELCLVHEQQTVPSLVLLEERPRAAGQDKAREGQEGFATRTVELASEPSAGGRGALWHLKAEVATVDVPVVVSTQRIPLDAWPLTTSKDGGALQQALRHCQRDHLRRRSRRVRCAESLCGGDAPTPCSVVPPSSPPPSPLQQPWVWTGEGWYQELDPQLAEVAQALKAAHAQQGHLQRGEDGEALGPLAIPAWVPPTWFSAAYHCHVLPATIAAAAAAADGNGLATPLTVLMRKTWTLTGAGALAAMLSETPISSSTSTADRPPQRGDEATAVAATTTQACFPASLRRSLQRRGLQNAFTLFPNYDAHTGLPFLASTRAADTDGGGESTIRVGLDEEEVLSILPHDGSGVAANAESGEKKRKGRMPDFLQKLTLWSPILRRGASSGVGLFQLTYAAQAVCWLKASAGEFKGSSDRDGGGGKESRRGILSLRPVPRVRLFCDSSPTDDGLARQASAAATAAAAASATLHQETYLTGFSLVDMPTWFTRAFSPPATGTANDGNVGNENDHAAFVAAALQTLLPPLERASLVSHGADDASSGHVYVLQLVSGPGETSTRAVSECPSSSSSSPSWAVWHRYNASDARVNFLYTVRDSLAGGSASSRAALTGWLCKKDDVSLSPCDVLFLDIRAALVLLSSPSWTTMTAAGATAATTAARNVVGEYEQHLRDDALLPGEGNGSTGVDDGEAASFSLSYGASHFVDFFFDKARQPLRWSFAELGAAMASYIPLNLPEGKEEEQTAAAAAAAGCHGVDEELVEDDDDPTTVRPPVPGQDAFLRSLTIRRVDERGYSLPPTGTASEEEEETILFPSLPPIFVEDMPAVDRRAFSPGSRLYEGYTHPSQLTTTTTTATAVVEAAATLGKERREAILRANHTARLESRLFSRRRRRRGGRHTEGEEEEEVDHVVDSPGAAGHHNNTSHSPCHPQQRRCVSGESGSDGGGADHAWRVEEAIRAERDRTTGRWSPWMRLIAPMPPPAPTNKRARKRTKPAGSRGAEQADQLGSLMDNAQNVEDATRALQSLVSSPLLECTSTTEAIPTQGEAKEEGRERWVHAWDLGIVVLCFRYKEPYVNAVNIAFLDDAL